MANEMSVFSSNNLNYTVDNMKIISIEGNIGTGKTTFIELIKRTFSERFPEKTVVFLKEPVDQWIALVDDCTGENILGAFYKDQLRWSYSFQMNAFITRMRQIESVLKDNGIHNSEQAAHRDDFILIMERCVYTDRNVFATLLRESGKISSLEWKLYDEWFAWLLDKCRYCLPTHYFYLNASADTSYQRMLKRNRNEEGGVSLEYLRLVEEKHNIWLSKLDTMSEWDANIDFEHSEEQKEKMYEKLDMICQN